MCILAFAKNVHPDYPLILIGNRDEFYRRPTAEASWWENGVLAGRDLEAGGTWLGMHSNGRFATLTNYRDIQGIKSSVRSRGELPLDFLTSTKDLNEYAESVSAKADQYNGFNLLLWEKGKMLHFSNYENTINEVEDGFHALSNALLDSPWYKTDLLLAGFRSLIETQTLEHEAFFDLLMDQSKAPNDRLPNTGLTTAMEKELSSICIRTPDYGTCSSTIIRINRQNEVSFHERVYAVGNSEGDTESASTPKNNTFHFNF